MSRESTTSSLLDAWWGHAKHELLVDRNTFMREAGKWSVTPIYSGAELAMIVAEKDGEIHLVKFGRHPITLAHLRTTLRTGLETRVPKADLAGRTFVERLGFSRVGTDQHDIFFRLERNKYASRSGSASR